MAKLQPIVNSDRQVIGYMYFCPGCGCYHAPYIRPHKSPNGASWEFNGDINKPTFNPSILTRVEGLDGKVAICHSFVQDGRIQFLNDCTHPLAGKVVDIPDSD